MDQQALPSSQPPISPDETFFPASLQTRDLDEELPQDLVSSEPVTQQVNMWNVQTQFQVQPSGSLLSQPGQFDLEDLALWEDYPATNHVAAPTLMSLQAANYMDPNKVSFQAPVPNSTGLMYPNSLQPCHDTAVQRIQSNCNLLLHAPLAETPSAVGEYVPYYDAGWQPINFEAIQEPASSLVPHISSTHSARTFTGLQTTNNSVSSEPLQIPQISGTMATGPFDFAEIERQAMQSSDYEEWQQVGQTDGSSFDSTSLDAPQIPHVSEIGALSTHGGPLAPPSQIVLATRYCEPPQSVTSTTHSRRLQIASRPQAAEPVPTTSSQAHVIVSGAIPSRNSSTQLTSKLNNKAIRKPSRPNKHPKSRNVGAIKALPGCQVYSLEPLGPLNIAKKHNARFGKERSLSEKLARKNGACILCRHYNKKCDRSASGATCARCIKMIQSGGATVIGASITACLTTFADAVDNLQLSRDKRAFVEIASVTLCIPGYEPPPDHETAIRKATNLLQGFSTPRLWRTKSATIMMHAAQHFTMFTSYVASMLRFGITAFGQALAELSFYNTAFLCRSLPRDSQTLLLEYFERQQRSLGIDLGEMIRELPIKPYTPQTLVAIWTQIEAMLTMARLAKAMFDASDAMSKRMALMAARTDLMLTVVAKLVSK